MKHEAKESPLKEQKEHQAKKMGGEYKVRLQVPKWAIEESKRREDKEQTNPTYKHQKAIADKNRYNRYK